MIFRVLCLLLVLTAGWVAELPPRFVKANGLRLCDHGGTGQPLVLRGTNLGGWLMFESWMSPCGPPTDGTKMRLQADVDALLVRRFGVATKNRLIDAYQSAWISEIDLDHLADLGMNLIRVPFTYLAFAETQPLSVPFDQLVWKPEAETWKYLDWVVAQAERRGIYVLFDLHQVEGPCAQGTPDDPNAFWKQKGYQERAVEIWRRMARHFVGNPTVIGYDLLNEPWSTPLEFYDACYKAIRAIDPDHTIFVETWQYGRMPKGDSAYGWSNVVCSLHLYNKGADDLDATLDQVLKPLETARSFINPANQVPLHVGEFFVAGDGEELWQKAIKAFAENDIPWNSWTYKTINQRSWCLINGAELAARPRVPDLEKDDAESIAAAWSAWRTTPELAMYRATRNRLAGPLVVDDELRADAKGTVRFTIDQLLRNDSSQSTQAELGVMELPTRSAHGTIAVIDGDYRYTADAGFVGTDRFAYQLIDTRTSQAAVRPGVVSVVVGPHL